MAHELIGNQTTAIGLVAAGKTLTKFTELPGGKLTECLFVNERPDEHVIKERIFEHCVFVGMGLKDARITSCTFKHCIFIRCYFRGARISGTDFTGSRFDECVFQNASIVNSKFLYTQWRATVVSDDQLLANMPEWPNVAHALLVELRNNAISSGGNSAAKRFHTEALRQTRIHQWRIATRYNDYYKKYTFYERLKAGLRWLALNLEKRMWGYGEQPLYLISTGFILLVMFAVYYLATEPSMFDAGDELTLSAACAAFDYSVRSFANATPPDGMSFASFPSATTMQALLGMVFASLLAAVVFRWISTRDF